MEHDTLPPFGVFCRPLVCGILEMRVQGADVTEPQCTLRPTQGIGNEVFNVILAYIEFQLPPIAINDSVLMRRKVCAAPLYAAVNLRPRHIGVSPVGILAHVHQSAYLVYISTIAGHNNSFRAMQIRGCRAIAAASRRLGFLAAESTTSHTETDTHVIVTGTARDRTTTTGDTTSLVVGESLLTTSVVRASVGGEGAGATVAIGRHNCSFLFWG